MRRFTSDVCVSTKAVTSAENRATQSVKVVDGTSDRDVGLTCDGKRYGCTDIQNMCKYNNIMTYPERLQYIEDKLYLRGCSKDPFDNVGRKSCEKNGGTWQNKYYCWNTKDHTRDDKLTDSESCNEKDDREWVTTRERHMAVQWYKTSHELNQMKNKKSEDCGTYTQQLEDTAYMHRCNGDAKITDRQECIGAGHTWERGICPAI